MNEIYKDLEENYPPILLKLKRAIPEFKFWEKYTYEASYNSDYLILACNIVFSDSVKFPIELASKFKIQNIPTSDSQDLTIKGVIFKIQLRTPERYVSMRIPLTEESDEWLDCLILEQF